jgi:hypothetical protein
VLHPNYSMGVNGVAESFRVLAISSSFPSLTPI